MSYRVKRIDPYWINNPALPAVALVAVLASLAFISKNLTAPAIAAAAIGGVAVILSTQPAVSAVLGALGLVGGLMTFVFVPSAQNAAMTFPMRLLSSLLFMAFYTVLMDGVVLLIAVLYNFFAGAIGLGGLSLDLENDGGAGED